MRNTSPYRPGSKILCRGVLLMSLTFLGACAGSGGPKSSADSGQPANEEQIIAGMQIVDCLLPGQLRSLGTGTYLTARRPIKTTAADCNIRGGEYVAFDRADYKTALKIWLPAAEAGDAAAQVNVGEIFEKGLGTEPNYSAAAIWYERAAKLGDRRGQFNLGTLYEQGLGVPKDQAQALNLYRQAWGLPADSLMYREAAQREQEALRASLAEELSAKDQQIKVLDNQMQSLKRKLQSGADSASQQVGSLQSELDVLSSLVDNLRSSQTKVREKISSLPQLRTAVASSDESEAAISRQAMLGEMSATNVKDLSFGRYYALVIGNRAYDRLDSLETTLNDAQTVAGILEDNYGFQVQLLLDANRLEIMKAINSLHDTLGEEDNLLIYYAGHGSLINVGSRVTGYWLPTNADPPPNDSSWVPNEFVTNHLGRIRAKRVLVIADSCFGGLLSSSPGHLFLGDRKTALDEEYIRYKLPRRSRLLLSSGGDRPVIDGGGAGHSIFARELIDKLRNNRQILSAPDLFASVKDSVKQRAISLNFVQEPIYKSIKGAGHEVGDFFFVPTSLR